MKKNSSSNADFAFHTGKVGNLSLSFFFLKKDLFILLLAVLGLHCCVHFL